MAGLSLDHILYFSYLNVSPVIYFPCSAANNKWRTMLNLGTDFEDKCDKKLVSKVFRDL